MAELDPPRLIWDEDPIPGTDPAQRMVTLPRALPDVGDDFDWELRDYEGFRRFLLEELQARFPERQRWTPADFELVLIEILATALDQLSDLADRVSAEAYLETARRFSSFDRWLELLDYRPSQERDIPADQVAARYRAAPQDMERDRQRAPLLVRQQRRMVSLDDYGRELEKHPLVLRATASDVWTGSWHSLHVRVSLWNDWPLAARPDHPDESGQVAHRLPPALREQIDAFHKRLGLRRPHWEPGAEGEPAATIRELLYDYLSRYRMVGQEIFLHDVVQVGVVLGVSAYLRPEYFQSEVQRDLLRVLGRGPDGFFQPGRLAFGQTLEVGDLYEVLMRLDGVRNVEFFKFQRYGQQAPPAQSLAFTREELPVCHNLSRLPEAGSLQVRLEGGRRG